MTAQDIRNMLFTACERAGGQRAWSRETGIPVSLVSQTLSGQREPADAVANGLGFFRVVSFVPVRAQ